MSLINNVNLPTSPELSEAQKLSLSLKNVEALKRTFFFSVKQATENLFNKIMNNPDATIQQVLEDQGYEKSVGMLQAFQKSIELLTFIDSTYTIPTAPTAISVDMNTGNIVDQDDNIILTP